MTDTYPAGTVAEHLIRDGRAIDRRDVRILISLNRVTINGRLVISPDQIIHNTDKVCVF